MVKQSHDPRQDQIKPGGRVGKPGGKKDSIRYAANCAYRRYPNGFLHLPKLHHQNIGNGTKDAGKKQHSDPSKIIVGIIEQCQGCQLRSYPRKSGN